MTAPTIPDRRGLAASLLLAALVAAGCASTPRDPGRADFKRLDHDGDGAISEAEFADHVIHRSFVELDANQDRTVTLAEWRAKETEAGAVALFEVLDLNADGQLGFEEFDSSDRKREALGRMFHTLDRNEDGLLEWEELRDR